MEHGKLNIYSKIERRMLSDIKELKKKWHLLNNIDIKEMKRT
jgi:hypothetical protein